MKTGRGREYTYFAADFETTVYDGQTSTEIWAAACCELNTEDVHIFGCFDDFFKKVRVVLPQYAFVADCGENEIEMGDAYIDTPTVEE